MTCLLLFAYKVKSNAYLIVMNKLHDTFQFIFNKAHLDNIQHVIIWSPTNIRSKISNIIGRLILVISSLDIQVLSRVIRKRSVIAFENIGAVY